MTSRSRTYNVPRPAPGHSYYTTTVYDASGTGFESIMRIECECGTRFVSSGDIAKHITATQEDNMKQPKPRDRIAEMRAEITRITGKEPTSSDPKYLASRLNNLRKHEILPISVPKSAVAAVAQLAKLEANNNRSLLVRLALREYAAAHGYGDIANALAEREAA